MPNVFAASEAPPVNNEASLISYQPPMRGAPTRRVGAGTRGICGAVPGLEKDFSLFPLVPEHTALSAKSQPILYWAVSHPFSGKFVLTITPEGQYSYDYPDAILETSLVMAVDAGLQWLDLADYSIELQPNQSYEWTISLICDPKNRSLDLHASGTVLYQPPDAQLQQSLLKQADKEHPFIYARNGFWYDALQSLSEQVQSQPSLKPVRAALLNQVGLQKVSQWLE
jgi:hypothetical protein